jgi:hypothetical protein
MNSSTITHLYLDDDEVIDLHLFLDSLDLPNLLDCTLSSANLSPDNLITFLNRHTSITSLCINRSNFRLLPDLHICSLPHLSRLSCRPDFATYLLSPEAVPSLRNVRLLNRQRVDNNIDLSSLGKAFDLLGKHHKIHSLSLTLS